MGISDDLRKALGTDRAKHSVKLTEAPNIRKDDGGKFRVPRKFGLVQADLIYTKEESKGYKYILTVVDIASRKMDAIPLRGRTHEDVIEGFEQVWKNGHIEEDCVQYLYTDPGSEFKNKVFAEYMDDRGIIVRHTMTARKNQMAIVEYYNYLIMKHLGQKTTAQELEHGTDYSGWSEDLKKIVDILNNKKYEKEPKIRDFMGDPKVKDGDELLKEGTVVHVRLQQPIDHNVDDKKARLHGGFRSGDLRWEKGTTKISNVIIVPSQPIRYMVEKYKNVSFIRKELLLAENTPVVEEVSNPVAREVKPKEVPSDSVSSRTRSKSAKYPNMV